MLTDTDAGRSLFPKRALLQAAVVALGLVSIVGSGGGGTSAGFPDLSCLDDPGGCPGDHGSLPPPAYAELGPEQVTTQVGGTLVFEAQSTVVDPSYRWCLQPAGASTCNEVAGATAASYTMAGVNLGDDGMTVRVTVSGSNGTARDESHVAVSSMPGVVYQDGEFQASDWTLSADTTPATAGPTFRLDRAASGGNPGAYRTGEYSFAQLPGAVHVQHIAQSAIYDPAVQGAIYRIDFAEDCVRGTQSSLMPYSAPLIEQAGRRFVAKRTTWRYCSATAWTAVHRSSLVAADFELAGGPACAAGGACPDFSAGAAPIHLGLATGALLENGLVPPVTTSQGIDNWRVTVWRR